MRRASETLSAVRSDCSFFKSLMLAADSSDSALYSSLLALAVSAACRARSSALRAFSAASRARSIRCSTESELPGSAAFAFDVAARALSATPSDASPTADAASLEALATGRSAFDTNHDALRGISLRPVFKAFTTTFLLRGDAIAPTFLRPPRREVGDRSQRVPTGCFW